MERIPEPELMDDEGQARAYAEADFEEPHNNFVRFFQEAFGHPDIRGYVLDLGCGPGDITVRFARAYPNCVIHGVDGSEAMLRHGREMLSRASDLKGRISLIHGFLPGASVPRDKYDAVISNSLLHHLPDPQVLWDTVKHHAASGAAVFIMDLLRPESPDQARKLVERYSGNEPEVLKRDFYNSLLAAFEVEEITEQLKKAELEHFSVKVVSDRHVVICGQMR